MPYQIVSKKCNPIFPAMKKYQHSSQRTPSFSSSSSSSSSFVSLSCNLNRDSSPSISLATLHRFSGIPFSWEHVPGIPKKPRSSRNKKELFSSLKRLPQPPSRVSNQNITSKKLIVDDIQVRHSNSKGKGHTANYLPKDPFFAALVECSKENDDDDHQGYSSGGAVKVSRSVSERFGFFNLSTLSCCSGWILDLVPRIAPRGSGAFLPIWQDPVAWCAAIGVAVRVNGAFVGPLV